LGRFSLKGSGGAVESRLVAVATELQHGFIVAVAQGALPLPRMFGGGE
jgi:hypothetical protein